MKGCFNCNKLLAQDSLECLSETLNQQERKK